MEIKLAIFDMAGTTVYDKGFVHQAFMKAFEQNGHSITYDDANKVMGINKPTAIRMMLEKFMQPDDISEVLINQIHDDFQQNMIDFYNNDDSVREVEGASEVFAELKAKGLKVACNTGFHKDIAQVIIDRLGWANKIDCWVSSDMVAEGRPAPFMIQEIMRQTGVHNTFEIAKIGDTPVDLGEGNNAQVKINIGVTWGAFDREELKKHPHTHLVDSIQEIPRLILD